MKPKSWIAGMLLMLAIAACSSEPFPTGIYEPAQPSSTSRITEFELAEEGTFAVVYYNGLEARGTYAVSDGQITLDESPDSPCFGYPITMSWTSSGTTLTLKTVQDTCPAMPTTDWAGEWARRP